MFQRRESDVLQRFPLSGQTRLYLLRRLSPRKPGGNFVAQRIPAIGIDLATRRGAKSMLMNKISPGESGDTSPRSGQPVAEKPVVANDGSR